MFADIFPTLKSHDQIIIYQILLQVIEQENKQRKVKYNNYIPGEDESVSASEVQLHEKRTRFSLSHDQDSIG